MNDEKTVTLRVVSWPREDPLPSLTAAENEVLSLVRAGLKDAEIAEHRATSRRTVSHQLQSIYGKLGVSSRWELLAYEGE